MKVYTFKLMKSGEQRIPGRLVNTRETGLSSLVFHIVFHGAFFFINRNERPLLNTRH